MASEELIRQVAEETYPADWPRAGETWRHYKGALVEVLLVAVDEGGGYPVVVYQHKDDGTRWVRPVAVWLDHAWDDEGAMKLRFTKVEG